MKLLFTYLSLCIVSFCHSQDTLQVPSSNLKTTFTKSVIVDADIFIGTDNFENYYYIKNNTLYKKTSQKIFTYTNTQLGEITSVDITNPLKIVLFYRDFNTLLFLDTTLNELSSPFNFTTTFSKNIAFVTISSNDNLWIYSFDDTVLQLWNSKTQKIQFTSQPLSFYSNGFKALQQISTYKNCWIIGDTEILKFNEYGTFLEAKEINGDTNIKLFKDGYFSIKQAKLYYKGLLINNKDPVTKKEVKVQNYAVNTNHIYIFDGAKILVFKILKK